MDTSIGLRGPRAALFSAVVVLLSAGSHVLMSRTPLPPLAVGGAFLAVFALAYVLAGARERSFAGIAGTLVPLELALDTVFTAGRHFCYGPAGGPVSGPLRALGLEELCGGAPLGGPLAEVGGRSGVAFWAPDPLVPWLLLGAHVSVGLLAAWWLRHGERALGRLAGAVSAFAFRPLALVVAAGARVPVGSVGRGPRPTVGVRAGRTRLIAHCVGRRGPPRGAASAFRPVTVVGLG
ncbi:hypothetical protein ACN20G_20225 [Streptomyces sp. BI20]|uniref:hypothetical protein n=1 Tax=Streptomyces sp. BI20 TaxID=3403460 RepID=UPI003C732145